MIAFAILLAATTSTSGALTLPQAVDGALARSTNVEAALLGLESAALSSQALDGVYDWSAFGEAGVNRDELPRRTPFESEEITTVPLAAGVSRLFPSGTHVDVRADAAWFEAPLPSLFAAFPEKPFTSGWTQGVTVTARHPLYGKSVDDLVDLQKQQIEADVRAGGARVAEGMDHILSEVHGRFWGQALAHEALRVADEAVRAAQEIYDLVDRKRKRGFADDRDTLRSAAAVQQARDQKLNAERFLDNARRILLDRAGFKEGSFARVEYDLSRVVKDESLESIVSRAEASSLVLRSLESSRHSLTTQLELARVQQRSSLFAVGRVGEQALLPNGTGFDDDFGFAAFVGLRWDKRFGNSEAQVRARQAEIELKRLDVVLAGTKQGIRVAAADVEAAISSARQRIKNAEDLVETQEKRYREEQQNFDIGRSLLRDVIEARQSLTAARFSLAGAKVALQMAATERDLLTGALTESWRERLASRNPAYRTVSGEKK